MVANFTANALLALGAAPAMVESAEEVPVFSAAADAVVVNLGMLTAARAAVIRLAVAAAAQARTPWVLDPVGAGAIPARAHLRWSSAGCGRPLSRGNASEILALVGEAGGGRGVDTGAASDAAVAAARSLAGMTGAIVAVTGAVDYIVDGALLVALRNGDPTMTSVTGMGCAASVRSSAPASRFRPTDCWVWHTRWRSPVYQVKWRHVSRATWVAAGGLPRRACWPGSGSAACRDDVG